MKRFAMEDVGQITIVTLCGPSLTDSAAVYETGRQLFHLVENLGKKKIIINFENIVEYVSPINIPLILLKRKIHSAGGKLVLCAPPPEVLGIFTRTTMTTLFNVVPTLSDAIQMLNEI